MNFTAQVFSSNVSGWFQIELVQVHTTLSQEFHPIAVFKRNLCCLGSSAKTSGGNKSDVIFCASVLQLKCKKNSGSILNMS